MQLLEVEVRHWRGLSTTLGDLSPRLNLILGPNEAGKSRIHQSVRFGLFESHKGTAQHKQALQSWASVESPFVRIAFSRGGIEYEIQKQYLKGASALLSGGGTTLRGEDAEEALRRLLGARSGSNRGASVADMGIWPLLMVEQGESRRPVQDALNDEGRERLQDRFSAEIGVASISARGQRLMALAEAEYDRYYTKTGQDSKLLRDARGRHADAVASLYKANADLERQKNTASALADGLRELVDLEQRAAIARTEAETARSRAEAAQQSETRLSAAHGAFSTLQQRTERLEEALRARIQADEAVERLERELATNQTQLSEREGLQQELDAKVSSADARAAEADVAFRSLRARADAVQRRNRRAELTRMIDGLREQIASIDRLNDEIRAARSSRASLPLVDGKALNRLNQLNQNAHTAAALLQGAAVSVVVHVKEIATVDGQAQNAGDEVKFDVTSNRRISIGSIAEVEIRPGGGELAALRDSSTDAQREVSDALRKLGVRDLAEAVAINGQLLDIDQQIAERESALAALSARAPELLREDQSRAIAELKRLATDAEPDDGQPVTPDAVQAADDALTGARRQLEAAVAEMAEHKQRTAALRATADSKHDELQRIRAPLSNRPSVDVLQAEVSAVNTERERATTALVLAQQEFANLGGAAVQDDARRLAAAAEVLANRVQRARSAVDQLKGTLQGLMADGHYESVQQADAAVEQAKSELERVERQASAAKRLWETLSDERRKVVERLTAPVIQRVKPYLQELFPGSTLDAGEALEIAGLQSGNLKEPYEALSGGAQEQLSLLTRIGLAEILAEDERLPLILDDVLINTDPERIKRLHRVLFRAADKLQVLLFSCHDVLFDGLGAERVVTLGKRR
jgi:DNA repair exonuclease SbcCD ATPase subunit